MVKIIRIEAPAALEYLREYVKPMRQDYTQQATLDILKAMLVEKPDDCYYSLLLEIEEKTEKVWMLQMATISQTTVFGLQSFIAPACPALLIDRMYSFLINWAEQKGATAIRMSTDLNDETSLRNNNFQDVSKILILELGVENASTTSVTTEYINGPAAADRESAPG